MTRTGMSGTIEAGEWAGAMGDKWLANIDGFWEPLIALLAHMRATEFIRPSLPLEVLKADRVEDILPRLRAAAARAPEGTKEMAPELAQKL